MKRPAGVAVMVGVLWMAAFVSLMVGAALLVPGTVLDRMWALNRPAYAAFHAMGRAAGAGFVVLAGIAGGAGAGLARGRRWAWWAAVGLFAANGVGDLAALFVTGDVVRSGAGALVAAGFVTVLLTRPVRCWAAQAASSDRAESSLTAARERRR